MESASANCRMYQSNLSEITTTELYYHCDGMQLKLADSDLGLEYRSSDYYVWSAGTSFRQLLFIFPTMVNLVAITLHYYHDSDSIIGRSHSFPKLRFYAVPDAFDIWDGLLNYRYVEVAAVPPDGEPSHRSVSINVNFNTKKVLMQIFRSSFLFAVSEVEFFVCYSKSIPGMQPFRMI